jgi:hypothetical protein
VIISRVVAAGGGRHACLLPVSRVVSNVRRRRDVSDASLRVGRTLQRLSVVVRRCTTHIARPSPRKPAERDGDTAFGAALTASRLPPFCCLTQRGRPQRLY